jgi:hypothetical protein
MLNYAPRHEDVFRLGGTAPHILDRSIRRRPLYLRGKITWYPLDRKLGGSQCRSRRGGEEKTSQPLQGIKPPNLYHPTSSQWLYGLNTV